MAYNLAYLRERLYEDKLDDDSLDPAIVDRFLNDSQKAIFNSVELPFTEDVFSGTISASQHIFTFPDNYKKAQGLIITSPEGSQRSISDFYIGFRDFNRRFPDPSYNAPASPSTWTLHGNKLYFSTPTDQLYTLTLYYNFSPAQMVEDTDVPDVPQDFEEALLMGAQYRIMQRNEDFELAAAIRNDFTTELALMVANYGQRQSAAPMVMGQPLRRRA